MAERHRSQDGQRDTKDILKNQEPVSQQGRSDGELSRKIGTRDEEKRAISKPAGKTRVRGADKRDNDETEEG